MPPSRVSTRDSGVAFILVLTVLLGLLVLASPFLTVAMNDHAVSESVIAEGQVAAGGTSLLRYGAWWLERTTDGRRPPDRAGYHLEEDFLVPIDLAGDRGAILLGEGGLPLMSRKDPRGDTWDLRVRDEQSIPNLWSAPPFLIAASLGRTVNTGDLKPEDTDIDLEDGSAFPPKTGAIWIDGERITYASRDGNTLHGCARGAPGGGRQRKHKAQNYVLDDRAREIAMLPFKSPRAKGGWREPLDVAAAKEISLYGDGVLTPVEADRLGRDFTVTSWRVTGEAFGPSQSLKQPIDPATQTDTTDGFKIRVKTNDGINAGTLVRITDGTNTEYAFVVASQRRGTAAVLTLAEPTQNAYAERRTSVAPMIRHPVNVNTASKDTLKRVLVGLQVTGGQRDQGDKGRVTAINAEIVADQLISNRPIKDLEQLRDILQNTSETIPTFTQFEMIAVFRNAVDANDWTLGNSSAPFCFKSYDYFTISASATVNDKAGTQRARQSVTERVRVAAPGRQVFRIDSQEDFERSIVRARDSYYTTTYPNPVERVNPYSQNEIPASRIPRMLLYSSNATSKDPNKSQAPDDARRGVFPNKTEGDLRLSPARMEGFNGYTQHFDGQAFQMPDNVAVEDIDPDGWKLDHGAFQLALGDSGQRSGPSNRAGGGRGGGGGGRRGRGGQSGAILGRTGANPLKIDMWIRLDTLGQVTFYDLAGGDPDQRITFSANGTGEIRMKVRDRTIQKPGDVEEACETIFRPPGGLWQPNTWYHVGASYRGCKPEEVSIWWDGMKRGEAKYQSVLNGSLNDTDTSFSIERADDWPQRGVCWVGREAVEFERSGNSLTAINYPQGSGMNGRGKRGTPACPHAAGEVVQLFGYSTAVKPQLNAGGVAIPRGGGNLASSLGPWNFASFEGNDVVPAPQGAPPIPWTVLDPSKSLGDQLKLRFASNAPDDYIDSFQTTGGYIIMIGLAQLTGLPSPGNDGTVTELAYYTSFDRGSRTLLGVQPVPQPVNPDLAGNATISTSQTILYLHTGTPTAPLSPYFCAVFPISVGMTSTTGYLTPKPATGQTRITPEHISLGVSDFDRIEQHKVEWIDYYHVDTAKKMLLCDDVNLLILAIDAVKNYIGGGQNLLPLETIGRDLLGMRGRYRTDIFGYGKTSGTRTIHQTSEDVTPVFKVVTYPGVGYNPPLQANQQPSPIPGHPAPGWGDSVTLETANATVRKRFDVTWSRDQYVSVGESPGQDFSQRQVAAGVEDQRDQYLRLIKFPSGELPRIQRPAKGRAGGDVDGNTANGRLDEIRVAPFESDRYIVWDQVAMGINANQVTATSAQPKIDGITETANEIPIANTHWYVNALASATEVILPDGRGIEFDTELQGFPQNDAGLVQIDDEIIAFRRTGRGAKGAPAILDCERGVMNTTAQKHGYGANVVFLDFLPVTMLSEALSTTQSLVNVASEAGFATTGGLVLVDRELIHFTEIQGRSFAMPPVIDDKGEEVGGLFRGRFGTTPARHDNEAIVIDMPFRYWDRWAESQDNPEVSFYKFALNRPGAWFEKFGYDEYRPTPNVQIVALVRTDQDVPWCTDSTRASPKLVRFEQGLEPDKSLHAIGRHGTALEARFYVRYLGNSFDPILLTTHDWKTTPELRWTEVNYFDETQVLQRESDR